MALEIEDMKTEVSRRDHAAEDIPPGEGTIGISLIDLAEILDQHKIWVETGGESCESRPHWRQSAGGTSSQNQFSGRGSFDGKFARSQPGARGYAQCKFARDGVARRELDGRKCLRRGWAVVWPTGRDQSFRRSAYGIDFGSAQVEDSNGILEG